MNKWLEVVIAWFIGGLIGRLIGHTYLVGYLDWPEVSGWLSVPIGSAIAWLAVEVKAIVPAIKHAYRWTQRPVLIDSICELPTSMKSAAKDQWKKFSPARGWRTLSCVSIGILISTWLIPAFICWYDLTQGKRDILASIVFLIPTAILIGVFAMFPIMSIGQLLERTNKWDIVDCDRKDYQKAAGKNALALLVLNPVGLWIVGGAIFCLYWLPLGTKEVIVWLRRIIRKTIQMINSSQRMAAMTGAAIGLSISQIYGFNPAICGGVCVLAGLVERAVFILAEKFVLGLKAKRIA